MSGAGRFARERWATGPRVGLVLGGGVITGVTWLVGALEALREHTGWDPASAEIVSGTSAGAVVATVLAAGRDPASLLRYAEDEDALAAAVSRATAGRERVHGGPPWPGSLALGLTGLLATDPRHRVASLVGFLPSGRRSTDDIRGLTHEAVAPGWPRRTELWLHACDFRTGERVTFGRADAPQVDLADAVAASCAVPGLYAPVTIDGRRYVDGGLWSFTNADALADAGCDVVVCLAPFASRAPGSLLTGAVFGAVRGAMAVRLGREARRLRDAGAQVATIELCATDVRAMGLNPMDKSRSRRVLETARASVAERLPRALAGVELVRPAPAVVPERVAA